MKEILRQFFLKIKTKFYDKTEIDSKLDDKSDNSHKHDDLYYTETEIDSKLSGKANSSHTHDDRYYTETETNTKLAGKSDTGHKHSASDITSGTLPIARGGTGVTTARGAFESLANGLSEDNGPLDTEYVIYKNTGGTHWGLYTLSTFWNYIKSKISSVLGLTSTNYSGNSATATTAENANKIEPNYTSSKDLTTVTSATTKYIKVADCTWTQTGTLQVLLRGNSFEDTLVINFGGGSGSNPMLCGHYTSNDKRVLSVIAEKGSAWNSNYSIYLKIYQTTTCTVKVALLKGNCAINITESTTAPTNISEWPISNGFFGNLTGNVTGKSAKSSFLDEYPGAGSARLTSGNIKPKNASEYGGMRKDVVTSSMTDSGHPGQDGHLLTMFWDNTERFDSQFYISNNGNYPGVKVRYKSNQTDYGEWVDVITSNNIGSQSVATATSVVDFGAPGSTIKIGYNGAGLTVDEVGYIAGYKVGTSGSIKDVSKDVLQSWLGLSNYLPLSGGTVTGKLDVKTEGIRIPTSQPSSLEDGDIWVG